MPENEDVQIVGKVVAAIMRREREIIVTKKELDAVTGKENMTYETDPQTGDVKLIMLGSEH